jgi:hypothetical protein
MCSGGKPAWKDTNLAQNDACTHKMQVNVNSAFHSKKKANKISQFRS